jgi:cytidylate kinase
MSHKCNNWERTHETKKRYKKLYDELDMLPISDAELVIKLGTTVLWVLQEQGVL